MKKLIYPLIFLTLISCDKSEDNSLQAIRIDRDEITMHYDESEQLGVIYDPLNADETPPVSWFSENNNVVEVNSNGNASGVRIGETRIMAQTEGGIYQDYCNIIIEPYSLLYNEPYIEFGSSIGSVKAFENRDILTETNDAIVYNGENSDVFAIMYSFEDAKLNAVIVMLEESDDIVDDLVLFLTERYVYQGRIDDLFVFEINDDVSAIVSVTSTFGLSVMYLNGTEKSAVIKDKSISTYQERLIERIADIIE